MDPISLLNFVAGLVNSAVRGISIYNTLYDRSSLPSVTIASMQSQCSCVEFALLQIQEAINLSASAVSMLQSDGALTKHFTAVFGACQLVFSILNDRLGDLTSEDLRVMKEVSRKAKLKELWKDQEMKDLLRNTESQASALNLLLAALQMRSNLEIHALLTRPKSVIILDKVTDDASSLISHGDALTRRGTRTLSMRTRQDAESVVDGVEFDFDVELVQSSVYRKALKFSWTRTGSVLRRTLSRGSRGKGKRRSVVELVDPAVPDNRTEYSAMDDRCTPPLPPTVDNRTEITVMDDRAMDFLPAEPASGDVIADDRGMTGDGFEGAPNVAKAEVPQPTEGKAASETLQEVLRPAEEVQVIEQTWEHSAPLIDPGVSEETDSLRDDYPVELQPKTTAEPEESEARKMGTLAPLSAPPKWSEKPQRQHKSNANLRSALRQPGNPKPRATSQENEKVLDERGYYMSVLRFTGDLPPIVKSKSTPRFSPRITFHETWNSTEYDRLGDVNTCNQLTPSLAQQIKEELNTLKLEMIVHPDSKIYTHFF